MPMKTKALLLGIVMVLVWYFPCFASKSMTNAKFVNYIFGRYDYSYFIIQPDNLHEFQHLRHFPFTAFMFINYFNSEKLANLTVKEIKNGSLGSDDSCCAGEEFYEVLKFDKLKGFEAFDWKIKQLDEFGIAAQKNQIIAKLIEIYGNYLSDFKSYLNGIDGTYRLRQGKLRYSTWNKLYEYDEKVEIDIPTPRSNYEQIDIDDYDFDKQVFRIELLSPVSRRGSKGWEYHYVKKFKKKYGSPEYQSHPVLYNIDFPEEMYIPMSLDIAGKMFREEKRLYCETILTVVPESGSFGYSGNAFFVMASNFNIVKVTKNYYKSKSWIKEEGKYVGNPVHTIEVESTKERPLW